MPINVTMDQETLRRFIKRRHPEYEARLPHWLFVEATYEGGREWFAQHIHRYLKEGDKEFSDRLERAFRFNHTREVVDLVQKYIFKSKVQRNIEDAPQVIKDFWDNATLSGLDIDQFMRYVGQQSSLFGMIWLFTDTNKPIVEANVSVLEAKQANYRAYTYVKKPEEVLDYAFGSDGQLTWLLLMEYVRDDQDPMFSSGEIAVHYRLLTPETYWVFEEIDAGNRGKVVRIIESGPNLLGKIQCFPVTHILGDYKWKAPGLVDDIAYLDKATANYLSNLDAIIQDQTFSQLAMPAQGMLPGEDKYDAMLEMGTKRIFTYDGQDGARPEYISPDPKQAGVILTVINKIINEIYHTVGLAGERTKQDNAVGIDNSSGVAKAYDFERINSLLASKAASLENAENRLIEFILAWNEEDPPEKELVKYPETFDVRSLYDEFSIAEKMVLIDAPEEVRRQQMLQVIDKLFPRLGEDLLAKMKKELQSWPPKIELDPGGPPTKSGNPVRKNPQTAKRQGQVTAKTS